MNTKVKIALMLMAGVIGVGGKASADDLGCQVVLCFAAPGGWNKVSECVPPVKKALRKMLRGSWKPRCAESGDADKQEGTYLKEGRAEFEDCAVSYGTQWKSSTRRLGEDLEPEFRRTAPRAPQTPICVNNDTGEEVIRSRNPAPDYFDIYIEGRRTDRIFWSASEAAPDTEVAADE